MPDGVAQEIETLGSRYGLTVIEREGDRLALKSQICSGRIAQPQQRGGKILGERQSERVFEVNAAHRGVLKQALLAAGYPAEDLAGYVAGDALDLQLRSTVSPVPRSCRLPKGSGGSILSSW